MESKGAHVIADIYLNEFPARQELYKSFIDSARESGLTTIDELRHDFDGGGLTAILLLAESHFSIHSFPERNYISIDCYTCGKEGSPIKAVLLFISGLDVKKSYISTFERGAND